jgi:hypothetical protein
MRRRTSTVASLLIGSLTFFNLSPATGQEQDVFDDIVSNDLKFQALRLSTQTLPSSKMRLEAQLFLDEKRVQYLRSKNDISATLYEWESAGLRSGDFTSDIIADALGNRIPRQIVRQKLMELGSKLSSDWSCETDPNCTLSAKEIEILDQFNGPFLELNESDDLGIQDPVYDGVRQVVAAEVERECLPGSAVTTEPETYSLTPNGNMIVQMSGFNCSWEFQINPFCGARACVVREYEASGSDIILVQEFLQ